MRAFISIDIPEKVKDEIVKIQKQIPEFKGKLTEKENLHLTLKFLGEIDEYKIEKIKEKLSEIKYNSFEAEIGSIGIFSEKFVRIVWLHIANCEKLQKQIDEKLSELFEKEKRFMSHLTIARVKSIQDKKEFVEKLYNIIIPKINFYVDSFNLKESTLTSKGSLYRDLERYNLKI